MIAPWVWGSAVIICLIVAIFKACVELSKNNHKTSLASWLALAILAGGLIFETQQGIKITASVEVLLLPLSFFLILSALIINIKLRTPLLTVLINPLALVMILVSISLTTGVKAEELKREALGDMAALHIFSNILGFTILFLATAVAGLLFVQDLKLKRKIQFKIQLPSLDLLERIVRSLNNLALLVLTAAIGSGDMLVKATNKVNAHGSDFYLLVVTWCVLLILNLLHFGNRISGQRFAWGSFLVALLAVIALLSQKH
jgi:ABC-type uncharacterized transport system permease subunit